jgi:hypothetical protein
MSLEIEYLPTRQLKMYGRNPRNHTEVQVRQLVRSIEEFGWTNPILVDEQKEIIAGHGRLMAAKQMGIKKVPCITISELTEAKKKALVIADNKLTENSGWNEKLLAMELDTLADMDYSLELTGFSADEIASITVKDLFDGDPSDEKNEIEETGILAVRDDVIFASANEWGIPELREDMLSDIKPTQCFPGQVTLEPDQVNDHVFNWSASKMWDQPPGGLLTFYVHDERFDEAVWRKQHQTIDRIIDREFTAVSVPDFSVYINEPKALNIYARYKAMYIGRLYQEFGIKIVPNLAWGTQETWDFCFAGQPKKPPVAIVQCRTTTQGEVGDTRHNWVGGFLKALEMVEPETVLVYGGQEHYAWVSEVIPDNQDAIFLPSYTRARNLKRTGVK